MQSCTLKQSFQPSGEEFDAKHKQKNKRTRAGGEALRNPAVCGASCSSAPVLGCAVCATQPGRVSAGRVRKEMCSGEETEGRKEFSVGE